MSELSVHQNTLHLNARLLDERRALREEVNRLCTIIGRAEAVLGPVENGAPAVTRETLMAEHARARAILQELDLGSL